MDKTVVIGGETSLNLKIDGSPSLSLSVDGIEGTVIQHGEYAEYTGEHVFTPSMETQTIEIANKLSQQNITINPIPSNYGLITWNGSKLTVS